MPALHPLQHRNRRAFGVTAITVIVVLTASVMLIPASSGNRDGAGGRLSRPSALSVLLAPDPLESRAFVARYLVALR